MRWLAAISVFLCGCGSEPSTPGHQGAGAGAATGPEEVDCVPGERRLDDGGCLSAGIPATECADGFAHDGNHACEPILPAMPCPSGQLAVPGDAACRDLADCGASPWGDAPVDASTQHVDGAYRGDDSDGSPERPWKTPQDAVAAAAPGALVAIAAGSYAGDLEIGKAIRLWGRCPQQVELVGDDPAFTAVAITAGGVELHRLAVRGPGYAVVTSGATGVVLDRVWIHDTGNRGMQVYDDLGETAVTVRDSLIERTERTGILVAGSAATLQRTVVRGVRSSGDPESGWGITTTRSNARRATLSLEHAVVEDNLGIGVSVWASDATIDASVVRDTRPVETGSLGRGIAASEDADGDRAHVELRRSMIERNHEAGVSVEGSDAVIEATTVRDMAPIEGEPLPVDVRGLVVQQGGFTGARGTLAVRRSLLDRNFGAALFVGIADAEIESVRVRDTAPQPPAGEGGLGIYLRDQATASVRYSAVERSADAGIAVVASQAVVEDTAVRDTRAAASGKFGDGVLVLSHQATVAGASIARSLIAGSERAGVANFAGLVTLDGSVLECNAIHLDGENEGSETANGSFHFEPGATNACRCEVEVTCMVQTASLAPPQL